MAFETAAVLSDLEVSDVSGQKRRTVGNVPADCTVGELVQDLLAELHLPKADVGGRPLAYHARLDREGRHLNASEHVAEALRPGDKVTLTPNIEAGR